RRPCIDGDIPAQPILHRHILYEEDMKALPGARRYRRGTTDVNEQTVYTLEGVQSNKIKGQLSGVVAIFVPEWIPIESVPWISMDFQSNPEIA
ncbi:hypothetical protein THAOC_16818, partial [Thalassiosira oceanica]